MKSLKNYILEYLNSSYENWKLPVKEQIELDKWLSKLFYELSKVRIYSLDNKEDRGVIYRKLMAVSGANDIQLLKDRINSYFNSEDGFAQFIINNHDEFVKKHFNLDWCLQWNETEAEKKYKAWKESKNYIESIDDEAAEERDLVIYDRWNPETHITKQFYGKRGKKTDHQVNMCRMDFHYEYNVKYYDCYPILAKNYFGNIEKLKQRAEYQLGIDDPNEFND